MKGLILSGGKGTRLYPLTYTRAKQLIPVANEPVLFRVIRAIRDAGITDIGIVVGDTEAEIREAVGDGARWDVCITYIRQTAPAGLAHAVKESLPFLGDERFVMFLGDNVIQGGISPLIRQFAASAWNSQIVLKRVPNPEQFGVAELNGDGSIKRLVEKPKQPPSDLALVGIYMFDRHIWEAVNAIQPSARGELEITDAIQWLVEAGYRVFPHVHPGWWIDTGKPMDMLEANSRVLEELKPVIEGYVDRDSEVDSRVTVEAGAVLAEVQRAAADAGFLFPLSLGAQGSAQIGGLLSTNAGGTQAVAYGIARSHVLGIEVVLADGRVLNNLNKLKKDNTGYDLKNLFIGAEGTLGIITAAVLRLIPRPRSVETAWLGVPSPAAAVELLNLAMERTAGGVTSFELMARQGVEVVLRHAAGVRYPLREQYPYSVIIELSSQARSGLRTALEDILTEGHARGLVQDAAIADSLEQAKAFWRIREMFGEMQRHEGGSIKHDVSVPIAAIPAFIEEANAAVTRLVPGARPLPFGHVGDGNIHYNVSQPAGANTAEFMRREEEVHDAVFAIVAKYGGSISAEHGIGIAKREWLAQVKDPVALELMRALKRTLDPKGILNPGKVL